MSSDDEAPDDISFKHSKETATNETRKISDQLKISQVKERERNLHRQQLYKEQKDKKKLDLEILQEANKELEKEEDVVSDEEQNEKIVFSGSESDDDSGINIQIQDLNSKGKSDLYTEAMKFKNDALYGKRIKRVNAEEQKQIKSKRKKKR